MLILKGITPHQAGFASTCYQSGKLVDDQKPMLLNKYPPEYLLKQQVGAFRRGKHYLPGEKTR
ncbi:hypothetical protein KCP69_10240 [Salmonella enterica subsp. enterica]|nr:hypothetical protein KCP69_10240 [Salmonella enterica subsp. enterica]